MVRFGEVELTMKTLFLFLIMFNATYSQSLIPEALTVKTAFDSLLLDSTSTSRQQIYVSAFPSDTKTFLRVFASKKFDQLYDGHDYIETFERCAANFPVEVISKCVDIGKNLVWDADAVSYLQHMSVRLAIDHTTVFIKKFQTLSKAKQSSLVTFYADVENHRVYQAYNELLAKLNSAGASKIANALAEAKTLRIEKGKHDH